MRKFEYIFLHSRLPVFISGGLLIFFYIAFQQSFNNLDFYSSHFFSRGLIVTEYNIFRTIFILLFLWLIYAPGIFLLILVNGKMTILTLGRGHRYATGFYVGAGIWTLLLLIGGLMEGYKKTYAEILVALVIGFSVKHLVFCLLEAWRGSKNLIAKNPKEFLLKVPLLLLLLLVSAAFLFTKGLYPAGGHDYYTHYFYYYQAVIRNGSILPNEIWYHFFYSKGAGLYFLGILLTDPLAPQLVCTAFIAIGTLTVALILARFTTAKWLPWAGAILFVAFLIYTPGPATNQAQGGWGDLEKMHELTAILILGILWLTMQAISDRRGIRLWVIPIISTTITAVIVTNVIAAIIGFYFAALLTWGLLRRERSIQLIAIIGGLSASFTFLSILSINYILSGVPLDQLLLYVWPIINLQKVNSWGVLTEVLVLHKELTTHIANQIPLTWEIFPLTFNYLRLDIWWPILVSGIGAAGLRWMGVILTRSQNKCCGNFRKTEEFSATLLPLLLFLFIFLAAAIGLGIGRQQPISFYRFSSFTYGPVLCLSLLAWAAIPHYQFLRTIKASIFISIALGFFILVKIGISVPLLEAYKPQYLNSLGPGAPNIFTNASFFIRGRFSLKDAYQNQQGWPGRMPWGGIYPAMEHVWKIIGKDTPVYSMHIHSYCMLPGCRVFGFMTSRITPNMEAIIFGSPSEAVLQLKNSGINYFFISNELDLYLPFSASPIFSPDTMNQYLGVKWTDGVSYLLTWRDNDTRPIDQHFLSKYRTQLAAHSMDLRYLNTVFDHLHENGLQPYNLPWCTTCAEGWKKTLSQPRAASAHIRIWLSV